MKDEKTKQKEEKLIEMVSSFCKENLNEEYEELCIKLVKKLGRKHNVPFKRGKIENWASAVVYTIAQINFLYDKSQTPYTTPDIICDFFNTKKSTASNKARDIRDLLNIGQLDKEFSSQKILNEMLNYGIDTRTGMIVPMDDDILSNLEPTEFYEKDDMDKLFNNVYKLMEAGETELALELLDTIPEDDSEYSRAEFYRSVVLGSIGELDDSKKHYKNAIDIELDKDYDIDELFDIGMDYFDTDEDEDAIDVFDTILDIEPKHKDALLYKSLSLMSIMELDEALKTINIAIDYYSEDVELITAKASIYSALGNNKQAEKYFKKALEIEPENIQTLLTKATYEQESEKLDNAIKTLKKILKIDPENIEAYTDIIEIYSIKKDKKNLKKYLKKAEKIDKNNTNVLFHKGTIQMMDKKYKKAIRTFDKLLKFEKDNAVAMLSIGICYMELGDAKKADEYLDDALTTNPMLIDIINNM